MATMFETLESRRLLSATVGDGPDDGGTPGHFAPQGPDTEERMEYDGTATWMYNCHSFAWHGSEADPDDPTN